MNISSKTIAAALLIVSFAGFASPVKSEIIVIDNFSVNTQGAMIVDSFNTFDSQSSQTSGFMKGNAVSRDMTLTTIINTDPDGIDRSIARVAQNLFKLSNDTGVSSTATINHQFAPIDVVSPIYGTSVGSVQMEVTNVDLDAVATITLVDANDESAAFSFTTIAAGPQLIEFSYDDFLAVNSSLDLTKVKSVSTTLSGPIDLDFQMRTLAFNTPEPSSVMLFSLAGIGLASRRRRKQR
ncbi:MAG: PEP-CTERM sorting domain-containing protein [Planctomycetaceae bacterium]|nr:PEP-CTERM sorting domain-containing protein [Planctomycetaceae bacterium]